MLLETYHNITIRLKSIRKYYEDLGYIIKNNKIIVSSIDLTSGSNIKIQYKCDICGNISSDNKKNYTRTKERHTKDVCYKCSRSLCTDWNKLKQEEVIKRLQDIHGDKYSYDKLIYKNVDTKVVLTCKKHGNFEVTPDSLLYQKSGCYKCKESKGEKFINTFLDKNKIDYIREYKFKDLKNILNLRVDFYLPEKNLVIEFDGEQHYIYSPDFHRNFCDFIKARQRDKLKDKYCEENNIKLLRLRNIRNPKKIEEELNKILCQ